MSSPQSYFPSEEFAMRNIDRKIYEDIWMQSLDDKHRLAWIMLNNSVCDDQGRFELNPRTMRLSMFFGDQISDNEIKGVVNNFVTAKKILHYEVDGIQYFQVINWWKYQSQSSYMAASKFPAPDGWTDRFHFTGKNRKHIKSDNWNDGVAGFITLDQVFANQQ